MAEAFHQWVNNMPWYEKFYYQLFDPQAITCSTITPMPLIYFVAPIIGIVVSAIILSWWVLRSSLKSNNNTFRKLWIKYREEYTSDILKGEYPADYLVKEYDCLCQEGKWAFREWCFKKGVLNAILKSDKLVNYLKELLSDFKYGVKVTFTTWLVMVIPFNIIGCYLYSIGFFAQILTWIISFMDFMFIVYLVIKVSHENHLHNCYECYG